jgi:hypothetical protein
MTDNRSKGAAQRHLAGLDLRVIENIVENAEQDSRIVI